ncbi:hypothetical protein H3S71_00650 [Commensalibacter sp. W8133]|uniref:cell division protein FtsL n=1 Tax=Commensalibacter sp. W8133 TaxID=2750953 RepID=UPI0018DCEAC8|nr:hypothetical protein [Commensalibacter sp. W8133]MBI0017840.1 hypothetical protein [Commensalibacter sp. W8133]
MIIRPLTLFCSVLAGLSGMILYTQKHKTTVLDHQIAKIVHDTERLKARTAMLRTEWTLLNQPDRLKTLANNFLPKLHPLAPTQFVQMSSLLNVLPPIQKEQIEDKTRKQLLLAVANNHGQTLSNPDDKPEPAIVSSNTTRQHHDSPTKPSTSDEKKQSASFNSPSRKPEIYTVKKTNNTIDSSDNISNKNIKKPPIRTKPVQNVRDDEENLATNDFPDIPRIDKKNIKTTALIKKSAHKPAVRPAFSIADSSEPMSIVKEKNNNGTIGKKEILTVVSTKAKPKHAPPVKIAQNSKQKQHYHSESAFGNDADDSLPAPVPFSQ